ncbi:Tol-Pal system protein TolB [Sphingomonas piscis]|uniref:Tol-Pal system protein TolB n=1 Tax=Sphingomonas piscis TaxID=2714943 RepID=A0A6G7YQ89_9SPHN|nr:Tol-Pal system beta propeller repeat protein TolB [Sphingomonas piscis]QIK78901.1 Tol-Pal system protein TolB [Sphingomonas piscis]
MRFLGWAALLVAGAASAQQPAAPDAGGVPMVAVPPLPTPKIEQTSAGQTHAIGLQVAEVIVSDLRTTGAAAPVGPQNLRVYSYPEVTGPLFQQWKSIGAKYLVTGFVQAREGDRLTIGCYLYDINLRREVARKGFVVPTGEWRTAAHRCSDAIYTGITKKPGMFDARIAYVSESGAIGERQKRIAVMDSDGSNHRFLTTNTRTVIEPTMAPSGEVVAYTSLDQRLPQIRIVTMADGSDRPLLPGAAMTFAPRFSPDGERMLFSMDVNGNTDLYIVSLAGGAPVRLTSTPGSDTAGSFSPDGSKIVFESERSGSPQLYVMNADGSSQQRISFGQGRYSAPVWSASGDLIAFSRGAGIGVMTATGGDERMITGNPYDEEPSWSPSGDQLLFQRYDPATRRMSLMSVAASGGEARVRLTPQDGSDPDWSQVQE